MQERPKPPRIDRRRAPIDPTFIRAHCPDCGEVRFQAAVLVVHIQVSGDVHVSYPCPRCKRRNAPPVSHAVAEDLRRAGAAVQQLARPAEADEPRSGPPIDEVDVAIFIDAMGRAEWQRELLD